MSRRSSRVKPAVKYDYDNEPDDAYEDANITMTWYHPPARGSKNIGGTVVDEEQNSSAPPSQTPSPTEHGSSTTPSPNPSIPSETPPTSTVPSSISSSNKTKKQDEEDDTIIDVTAASDDESAPVEILDDSDDASSILGKYEDEDDFIELPPKRKKDKPMKALPKHNADKTGNKKAATTNNKKTKTPASPKKTKTPVSPKKPKPKQDSSNNVTVEEVPRELPTVVNSKREREDSASSEDSSNGESDHSPVRKLQKTEEAPVVQVYSRLVVCCN